MKRISIVVALLGALCLSGCSGGSTKVEDTGPPPGGAPTPGAAPAGGAPAGGVPAGGAAPAAGAPYVAKPGEPPPP